MKSPLTLVLLTALLSTAHATETVDQVLIGYQSLGAGPFNIESGRNLWRGKQIHQSSGETRSCTSCHGSRPSQPGKHIKTGKAIKPMSPHFTEDRFTDSKKIEKWFKRNCKWTLSRECTIQEKGDLLTFLLYDK